MNVRSLGAHLPILKKEVPVVRTNHNPKGSPGRSCLPTLHKTRLPFCHAVCVDSRCPLPGSTPLENDVSPVFRLSDAGWSPSFCVLTPTQRHPTQRRCSSGRAAASAGDRSSIPSKTTERSPIISGYYNIPSITCKPSNTAKVFVASHVFSDVNETNYYRRQIYVGIY